ncbi:MAG TPA: hypothetical protein VGH54_10235 [Mycobacterium sp.]|jgi:hypothetical protein|uniref:hypothetical protein n=1 Tax=Mycobacterium sp. TaxID=1785 RepID=UPI002F3FB997
MTTIAPWIADLSFGHDNVSGATLKARGCVGVICYAGCDDTRKNATKANVDDWLAHSLLLGVVIENGAEDILGGAPAGHYLGSNLATGVKSLGYDLSSFVGYLAADWNTAVAQESTVDAGMAAFASHIPIPGLYGNSYAIDYIISHGHAKHGWQSNSTSFSYGPSPHADLLQRYNDPRAAGLPVDVNDIQHTPLGLMGERMTLTQEELGQIWEHPIAPEDATGKPIGPAKAASQWLTVASSAADRTYNSLATLPANIATAVAAKVPGVSETALVADLTPVINAAVAAHPAGQPDANALAIAMAPVLAQHIQLTAH